MPDGTDRSTTRSPVAQATAAVIAVVALAGLVLNFIDLHDRLGSAAATLWALLDYFTITTNALVAVLFVLGTIRPDHAFRPTWMAGLALSVLLVGVVNGLLLRGLYRFTPIAHVADVLLHEVTPVLVPAFWLAFVPKGALRLRDPLLWAIYPIGYFVFALARGGLDGHYPYPFMNVAAIGWSRTAINALVIAAGFMATGAALVWLDGMLAGRSRPRP